ncbi:MAG: gamma-glutamyltransferase, partial [Actinomycetota bacterium]|nr:gamma-glutamyltransferase [Actinomycetota bacterium]
MAPRLVPVPGIAGVDAAAASADHRGTQAAMAIFERGGNAVDAAIAANAVLTVTAPHLCGLGGDLFALVHDGTTVHALNASGRAGSGTDAAALRSAGFTAMPFRHHPAAVTIPGCVDGWTALHERFGSLPLGDVLARAIELAWRGTFASPLLVASLQMLDDQARPRFGELVSQVTGPNAVVARPGIARTLEAVADAGRDAFYGGEFGAGLVQVSEGMIRDG